MRNYGIAIVAMMVMAVFGSAAYATETPYQLEWIRQLGTSNYDIARSVAVDNSGNAYISGYTTGNLGGTNAGNQDAFLAKYDTSGTLLWTRQLGTSSLDVSYSVTTDSLGNAYISGWTQGNLGGASAGNADAFFAKYDTSGELLWTRQLGTISYDISLCVAVDSLGSIYISGQSQGSLGGSNAGGADAFLAKYDASGGLLWTQQLGTSSGEESWSVAVDSSGSAYISGWTDGSISGQSAGGRDAFLAKYDTSGELLWVEQLGTSNTDYSRSIAIDNTGNAYISGSTRGALGGTNEGDYDAFLAKYDSSGNLLWIRQLGTSATDTSFAVAVDDTGNAYISGYTESSFGDPNAGNADAFLAKYDTSGALLWTRQIGTVSIDVSLLVAVDDLGNAYITGETQGDLSGPNAGSSDAFLAKFSPAGEIIPEPGTIALFAPALLACAGVAYRKIKK